MLLLLIAPAVVTYTWIQQRKRVIKKEVKWKLIAGIDKSELVLLKFSKQEIHTKLDWKHSKEFEYNTQMYDIVEKQNINDSVYYWCWWDFEETKLNKQLRTLLVSVYKNDIPFKKKQSEILDFYKSLYFFHINVWQPFIHYENCQKINIKTNIYQYLFSNLEHPPPNVF